MSTITSLKPDGHVLDASRVFGVTGSGVSAACGAATYERGAVAAGVVSVGAGAAGVAAAGGLASAKRSERPAKAVAVAARVRTEVDFDRISAANGADPQLFGQQKTQLLTMWALRGLDPWSEPT